MKRLITKKKIVKLWNENWKTTFNEECLPLTQGQVSMLNSVASLVEKYHSGSFEETLKLYFVKTPLKYISVVNFKFNYNQFYLEVKEAKSDKSFINRLTEELNIWV